MELFNKREYERRRRAAREGTSAFRKEFAEAQRYYHNDQWSTADKAKLKEEDRIPVVFNSSTKVVHAVAGSEVTNRFAYKYKAQTSGGDENGASFAEMVTAASRWIRKGAYAEHHDSHAFRDAVLGGLGVTETYVDMTDGLVPRIKIRRVSPFEFSWDSRAEETNFIDARWICRDRAMDFGEFKMRFGAERFDSVTASYTANSTDQHDEGTPHDQTASNNYASGGKTYDLHEETIRVTEYQWTKYVPKFAVYSAEKEDFEVFDTKDQAIEFSEQMQQLQDEQMIAEGEPPTDFNIQNPIEFKERQVYRTHVAEGMALEQPEPLPGNMFSYAMITGYLEHTPERTIPYGLHRYMKHPQMFQNKMLSQLIHTVSKNPKGTILHEGDFFTDPDHASENWARPSAAIEVEEGMLTEGKYEIVEGRYPSSMERVATIAMESTSRAVGLSDSYFLNGAQDLKRTPSSSISQARQSSMVVLSNLFDSLRLYRSVTGKMMLHYMQFIPENTWIRVALPPQYRETPVPFRHNWLDKIEYDVIIDEAPSSATGMQEFFDTLMQTNFGETLLNRGLMDGQMLAEIIPNAPAEFRDRMRQKAEEIAAAQQAMQQAAQGAPPQGPPTNGEPV